MNIVALVPLRGGSKSIPKKNIKLLAGKPMSAWSLAAASNAALINSVYVSTESEEISNIVDGLNLGVKLISRPAELSTDEASTESVILHFMTLIEFDLLITIQATSPLLQSSDLDQAICQFNLEQLDSMLSAVRSKRFFWSDNASPINYKPTDRPRRQEFKGTLMENGAFYITKRQILDKYKCRLGGRIGIYEMDEASAIEIDEPEDWDRVERVLIRNHQL